MFRTLWLSLDSLSIYFHTELHADVEVCIIEIQVFDEPSLRKKKKKHAEKGMQLFS